MIFIKANTIYEVPLEDASIYKIEILKSDISIYIQLYNAKRVKIIFLNYYGIIDYHAIGQEIGDFEIQHDSDFIQQIISEEIESGASRAYMDGLTFTHFRLFETWKKKKILEIVCEKIEVEYLDKNFKKQKDIFTGFIAQIIQHEIDHFNGIII